MFLILVVISLCFIGLFLLYVMIDVQCGSRGSYQKGQQAKLVLSKYRDKIDQERKLISRVLHDSVNQKVIVSKLLLENLSDSHESKAIKELLKVNNEIYSECRNIINSVRVETLESLGLVDAIQELIETYKKFGRDIEFDIRTINLQPLSPKVSTTIYYIVSEALLNIIKHSNANKVYIYFKKISKDKFQLSICDDGVGFSNITYGVGLTDIEERVNDIGGKIKITSEVNNGVQITIYFSSTA